MPFQRDRIRDGKILSQTKKIKDESRIYTHPEITFFEQFRFKVSLTFVLWEQKNWLSTWFLEVSWTGKRIGLLKFDIQRQIVSP